MNHKSTFLIIILAMLTCISTEEHRVNTMTAYEMRISLKQLPLPISMSSILLEKIIAKIQIKMGHLTSNHQQLIFSRGIIACFHNKTQLSDEYLTRLKSLFQISQDKRFQVYLPQQKLLMVADPNDRFCTEHIEYFLKYFYPCKNFASLGLEKLINPAKLLEKYLTFELTWLGQDQILHFKLIFPRQRSIETFQKQTNCGKISVYEIDFSLPSAQYQNKVTYHGQMINRWYHPDKCISHNFEIQQIDDKSSVKIITMLPLGFIFDNFTIYPADSSVKHQMKKIGTSLFLHFTLALNKQSAKYIRIHVHFHSSLPPFETFQTIAAGGEELMNVPIYFEGDQMHFLHSKIVSQRLLQPDFSIPFQTITFTVGIVGYLWINLWRIHKFTPDKQKGSRYIQ